MSNFDRSGLHTPQDNLPLNQIESPSPEVDDPTDGAEALFGNNPEGTAYIDRSDIDLLAGPSMTDVYQGDADRERSEPDDTFDMLLERELRAEETDDVMEAVEEGMTYVPPVDPPFSLDPNSSVHTPYDLRNPEDDDDMVSLIRDALRGDSATVGLVNRVGIIVKNGNVVIRGVVDDLDDTDNLVAIISEVEGVESVRDETTVLGL